MGKGNEVLLLGSGFLTILMLASILLALHIKSTAQINNTFYREELKQMREEIMDLKHIVKNEITNVMKQITN